MRALLILVLLLASPCVHGAALSGCFCNSDLNNIAVPNSPQPSIQYFASSICFCATGANSFSIQVNGRALVQPNNINVSVPMATCSGNMFFDSFPLVVFSYNSTSYCSSSASSTTNFCSWVCTAFGGTYNFFYDQPTSTRMVAFTPEPIVPPIFWGDLKVPIKMICNDTTCGDASSVIPPVPLPDNITSNVRQRHLLEYRSCLRNCNGAFKNSPSKSMTCEEMCKGQ